MVRSRVRIRSAYAVLTAGALASAGCGGRAVPSFRLGSELTGIDGGVGDLVVEAGVVLLSQPPYACPGISGFGISPAAVLVDQPSELTLTTVGPPPSAIVWSVSPATGGILTFADGGEANATFQCLQTGEVTVAVTLELIVPDAGDVCDGVDFTSITGTITCQ